MLYGMQAIRWFSVCLWWALGWHAVPGLAAKLDRISLPDGFRIGYFATGLPDARSMALGEHGTLFVGTRRAGKVYALLDRDGDGRSDRRWLLADGLNMPNGIGFADGALLVAENHRITRFDAIESRLERPPAPRLVARLPERKPHGWRYLATGPDNKLYVSIGAPCNICDEPGFGEIWRIDPADGRPQVIARGVRNSVGFDWDPASGDLWFSDNGRDWLGDDRPPDEINRLQRPGQHFGFPWCHGGDIPDPEFGQARSCAEFTRPVWRLGAHVAPLGIHFYRGSQFPGSYRGRLFVVEHGSWNRTEPVGYRIVTLQMKDGLPARETVFAAGWLGADGQVRGRPVDLLELPDGSLLVSDDKAGVIYRIAYAP